MCRTDRSNADGKVEKTQVKDHACRDGRGCCGNRCCQKQSRQLLRIRRSK